MKKINFLTISTLTVMRSEFSFAIVDALAKLVKRNTSAVIERSVLSLTPENVRILQDNLWKTRNVPFSQEEWKLQEAELTLTRSERNKLFGMLSSWKRVSNPSSPSGSGVGSVPDAPKRTRPRRKASQPPGRIHYADEVPPARIHYADEVPPARIHYADEVPPGRIHYADEVPPGRIDYLAAPRCSQESYLRREETPPRSRLEGRRLDFSRDDDASWGEVPSSWLSPGGFSGSRLTLTPEGGASGGRFPEGGASGGRFPEGGASGGRFPEGGASGGRFPEGGASGSSDPPNLCEVYLEDRRRALSSRERNSLFEISFSSEVPQVVQVQVNSVVEYNGHPPSVPQGCSVLFSWESPFDECLYLTVRISSQDGRYETQSVNFFGGEFFTIITAVCSNVQVVSEALDCKFTVEFTGEVFSYIFAAILAQIQREKCVIYPTDEENSVVIALVEGGTVFHLLVRANEIVVWDTDPTKGFVISIIEVLTRGVCALITARV